MSQKHLRLLVGALSVGVVLVAVALALLLSRSGPSTAVQPPVTKTTAHLAPAKGGVLTVPGPGTVPGGTVKPPPTPTPPALPTPPKHTGHPTPPTPFHSAPPPGFKASQTPDGVALIIKSMLTAGPMTVKTTANGHVSTATYSNHHVCLATPKQRIHADAGALFSQYLPFTTAGITYREHTAGGRLILNWTSAVVAGGPRTTVTVDAANHRIVQVAVGLAVSQFSYGSATCVA
jgi:hypothetical protein